MRVHSPLVAVEEVRTLQEGRSERRRETEEGLHMPLGREGQGVGQSHHALEDREAARKGSVQAGRGVAGRETARAGRGAHRTGSGA